MEHVIATLELSGALDREHVEGLLDDAHDARIALIRGAERGRVGLGDVEAGRAVGKVRLDRPDRGREGLGVSGLRAQDVVREPLRGLRSDARELSELVDEAGERPREGARQSHPRDLEAAGHAAEPLRGELARLRERVAERGAHEILQGLDIVGIDRVLLDAHVLDLLRAAEDDDDRAATRGAFDGRLGEFGLRFRHVGLHPLRHLRDVAHVLHSLVFVFARGEAAPRSRPLIYSISMMRSGRRKISSAARCIGSSCASGAPAGSGCTTQRTRTATESRSERPRSSSVRRRSCQKARAKSVAKPITMVLPSIAVGSASTKCAALPRLCAFASATSSAHALRTSSMASDAAARRAAKSITGLASFRVSVAVAPPESRPAAATPSLAVSGGLPVDCKRTSARMWSNARRTKSPRSRPSSTRRPTRRTPAAPSFAAKASKSAPVSSHSETPSSSSTSLIFTDPSEKVATMSRMLSASRSEPCACRAIASSAAGSHLSFSCSQIAASCLTIPAYGMRRRSKRCVRETIVPGIFPASVVASTKIAWGGGSSSVFRSALNASLVS